mmetsp:Transcript_14833/g.28704  ORF Transcript_14833/g.28704 Transcript_14833/m.28704 type:complete len:424 (+) Transcript_14833:356-1627(+)|eukprot:CAMPEP_0171514624 /NCGR_PEP_ID=MMETSP0959-20130129/2959_1 /TAXON_ID=87120 /ORGANISM="Aurantiochytrium limacinum, Strain ATCCMYA-1381" /LENGTH=423 /DNA_ID=CAMNT_0012052993 /DNA_START=304 /DNA_END=1575 /DNA_ORIENTATION=+
MSTRAEKAKEAREKGNSCLQKGDFDGAVAAYTRGIEACGEDVSSSNDEVEEQLSLLLSNRSAAHLKKGNNEDALADADACLRRKPTWGKAHGRRGAALFNLGRIKDALAAYEVGIETDTSNATLRQGAEQCRELLKSKDSTSVTEEPVSTKDVKEAEDSDKAERVNAEGAADDEDEDDPFASFLNDIEAVESSIAEAKTSSKVGPNGMGESEKTKSVVDHAKETEGWTASNQIDRILCKNYEWVNTNPFAVLGIQNEDATAHDVKKRYHKLSTIVHPDKNSDSRAEAAFDEVKRAYERLKDDDSRERVAAIIRQCKESVKSEREQLLDKGYSEAEVNEKLGALADAMERKIKTEFATRELERRKNEHAMRKYQEREMEKEKSEQDYWQSVKQVEEGMRETRETRAKAWQGFAGARKGPKRRKL